MRPLFPDVGNCFLTKISGSMSVGLETRTSDKRRFRGQEITRLTPTIREPPDARISPKVIFRLASFYLAGHR
jgi:hypothetical protein